MSASSLLHFRPLYQTRVWGGRRLETCLGRNLPDAQPYGESWELVDREHEQSVVASGTLEGVSLHDLWSNQREEMFGAAYAGHPAERFPILIKVLDCSDDLSLQVHPPADIAPALGGEPKTEMWYVTQADEGAQIYAGLKRGVTRESFEAALGNGSAAGGVHNLQPAEGDSLFLPSGRLHALGKGLLIYEVQQNSDTTYRVFDWNRLGLDGKPRDLHVEQSLRCIDFADVEPELQRAGGDHELAACDYFKVTRCSNAEPRSMSAGRFRLIMPITTVQWAGETLVPGQLSLLPASAAATAEPQGEWLEIELPVFPV